MVDIQDIQRIHPVGLAALLAALLLLALSRRPRLPVIFIAVLCLVPTAQRLVVFGLDLPFSRLVILFLVIRVLASNLAVRDRWRAPDVFLLSWWIWSTMSQGLLFGELGPMVTRFGYGVDAIGAYFVGRALIDSRWMFERLVRGVSILAAATLPLVCIEWLTGRNLFAVLGGVPELTVVREGRLRCQGPFAHPIMAGLFWSVWAPLLLASALNGGWSRRRSEAIALVCVGLLVTLSASSTPVMAIFFAVAIFGLFRYRAMASVAIALVALLLMSLHFVMEHGAHHLLARVNLVGGSTGWHRFHLMDQAIARVDEWWWVGVQSTRHWGLGLEDVTNQFVLEGVRGGLLGLGLYVCFLGSVMIACVHACVRELRSDRIVWAMFAALVAVVLSYLAVSIFGAVVPQVFFLLGAATTLAARSPLGESCDVLPAPFPTSVRRSPALVACAAPLVWWR